MCGPGSDDQIGMTGLGSKVLKVENKSNQPKVEVTSPTVVGQVLEERLKDVR